MVESLMSLDGLEEIEECAPIDEQPSIETESGVYTVDIWEGDSADVFSYLQQINEQFIENQDVELFTTLSEGCDLIHLSNELIEVEREIDSFSQLLQMSTDKNEKQIEIITPNSANPNKEIFKIDIRSERPTVLDRNLSMELPKSKGPLSTSIFSLAGNVAPKHSLKSIPQAANENKKVDEPSTRTITPKRLDSEQKRATPAFVITDAKKQEEIRHLRLRQDQLSDQGQQKNHEDGKQDRQKRWQAAVESADAPKKVEESGVVLGIENIYVRFMALMGRILGQAEAEAHDLYQKIKGRTDRIDLLTTLVQKINASSGGVDWEHDQKMRKLVDQARSCGVEIPEGKYSWSEDEKILFKENIQMRKDSMEKVTQLERTDMQRYLQEASQCHQARSNILKLLKEVTDSIIYNMR